MRCPDVMSAHHFGRGAQPQGVSACLVHVTLDIECAIHQMHACAGTSLLVQCCHYVCRYTWWQSKEVRKYTRQDVQRNFVNVLYFCCGMKESSSLAVLKTNYRFTIGWNSSKCIRIFLSIDWHTILILLLISWCFYILLKCLCMSLILMFVLYIQSLCKWWFYIM